MPLRRRVGLVAAAAVGVAVVFAAVVCYFVVRDQLRGQVDNALRAQAAAIQHGPTSSVRSPAFRRARAARRRTPRSCSPTGPCYRVGATSRCRSTRTWSRLRPGTRPVHDRRHRRRKPPARADVPRPVLTIGGQTVAVQLARPLEPRRQRPLEAAPDPAAAVLGGIALAAALGRLAARRVLAPLAEVADTAQHISETEDLSARIQVRADDEVGQLATRFNAMLERLEASRDSARRVRPRPAPARRRRLARAAHAGHEPAHQHRGAAGRRPAQRGRAAADAGRRRRADGGAERASWAT